VSYAYNVPEGSLILCTL